MSSVQTDCALAFTSSLVVPSLVPSPINSMTADLYGCLSDHVEMRLSVAQYLQQQTRLSEEFVTAMKNFLDCVALSETHKDLFDGALAKLSHIVSM